jgi:hypothetical protein
VAGQLKRLLLGLASVLLAGCASAPQYQPLPQIVQPVTLRVAYFHNLRLPEPPEGFVDAVLHEAAQMMRDHLDVAVRFERGPRLPIDEAFGTLSTEQQAGLAQAVYGWGGPGDRGRLVNAMKSGIEKGGDLAGAIAQARPLIGAREPASWDELAAALVDVQLGRVAGWKAQIGSGPEAHFPGWIYAARSRHWPFEVVVTNQLIASAEYDWMEPVTVARAGVTNGLTTQSRGSAFDVVSVLTLFPFIANDAHTLALRGGRRGGGAEAVRWAAALLVHELGHQLLHLGHPPDKRCVMMAATSMRYHEWVAGLDASACRVGSSPVMKPGSHRYFKLPPLAP